MTIKARGFLRLLFMCILIFSAGAAGFWSSPKVAVNSTWLG